MKNIAVFCDGTWQDFSQPHPTNVARLARSVAPSDGSTPQLVRYDDGVGVGQGVMDTVQRLAGGAFGKGLDYKIARAYEFLCLNYTAGDRIFLFGFSRGAYTVRSLAGLLRHLWILRREEAHRVHEATRLYRRRPREKDGPQAEGAWKTEVAEFVRLWCHPLDDAFTAEKAYDPSDPASLAPGDPERCGWIQYVGVWDTVGSLGVPRNLPFADLVGSKYDFHDADLSRFVRSARHAVALDERRGTFEPTLWDNVEALNENARSEALEPRLRPYQQQWFPGGHGAVGGGGASPISFAPLLWVAEGAARAGLVFEDMAMRRFAGRVDPEAEPDGERSSLGALLMRTIAGMRWRAGPSELSEVSLAARIRWRRIRSYRPRSLSQVQERLAEAEPPSPEPDWFAPHAPLAAERPTGMAVRG